MDRWSPSDVLILMRKFKQQARLQHSKKSDKKQKASHKRNNSNSSNNNQTHQHSGEFFTVGQHIVALLKDVTKPSPSESLLFVLALYKFMYNICNI